MPLGNSSPYPRKPWDHATWSWVRPMMYTHGLAEFLTTFHEIGLPFSWDSPVRGPSSTTERLVVQGSLLVDAVQSGRVDLVRWLMEHEADPSRIGFGMGKVSTTPLLTAVRRGDERMVEALLDDPRTLPTLNLHHHGSPLGCAAGQNNVSMVERLLEAGALIDGPTRNSYDQAVTMRPVDEACSHGAVAVVERLLNHAPNREAMLNGHKNNDHFGSEGTTLLMQAAWFGHSDLAQWLMEQGADVDARDSYGFNVLQRTKQAIERKMKPSGGSPQAVLTTIQQSIARREHASLNAVAIAPTSIQTLSKPRL